MSHTLLILKIYITFKDVQMMSKEFFDISIGFRFWKLHFGSVPSIPVAVLEGSYFRGCFFHLFMGKKNQNSGVSAHFEKTNTALECKSYYCRWMWRCDRVDFLKISLCMHLFIWDCTFEREGHSGFLEHWHSQKSLCNIWQRFSCLLDE